MKVLLGHRVSCLGPFNNSFFLLAVGVNALSNHGTDGLNLVALVGTNLETRSVSVVLKRDQFFFLTKK